MTTPARELAEQRRWQLKPRYAGLRVFDEFLSNEFRSADEHETWLNAAVREFVRFAAVHTPYYANLFARLGLRPEDIGGVDDLPKLPALGKPDVIQFQAELRSRALPPGEKLHGPTRSSGTTGRPVIVMHSYLSTLMFGLLRQRSARWHGLDPMQSRLDVRPHHRSEDAVTPDQAIMRRPGWLHLDEYFHTGPEYAFSTHTPTEIQVDWIRQLRPRYAMSFPGIFDEWLLAGDGKSPCDSLDVLIGIGAQLTPSLRQRLEQAYRIPIHQAYGLNEIGSVAIRCSAGRYHVNVEHCFVEILAEDGHPCAPGETGHVLVTGHRNFAMPLIRYDTGDLAEVVAGPCPCGRTLPSFGEIAGRARNYAGVPKGTRERVRALRVAIEKSPSEQLVFLRRFQIHQDRQNRFTLRLQTAGPMPDAFRQSVLSAWEPVAGTPPAPLTIVEIDEIATPPHGKPMHFVSEFHADSSLPPEPQAEAQPGATN